MRVLLAFFLLAGAVSPQSILILKKKAGAPSYLVNEGFEETGAPTVGTWTATGTVDWDEAIIYHDGAQALHVDSTVGDGYAMVTFAAANDIYGELWFYPDHIGSVGKEFVRVFNGTTQIASITHRQTGVLRVSTTGGTDGTMTLTIGEDSWVHVWWHFTAGTGANATMRAWWATGAGAHPGNGNAQYYAASSNGTSTLQADRIRLVSDNAGTVQGSHYFDSVKVNNAILW